MRIWRERRPCVVISPDELNEVLLTAVVARMVRKPGATSSKAAAEISATLGEMFRR
jgi:mRNA-degrading endonuclease toxin of MazEF toxin-antitoxin module